MEYVKVFSSNDDSETRAMELSLKDNGIENFHESGHAIFVAVEDEITARKVISNAYDQLIRFNNHMNNMAIANGIDQKLSLPWYRKRSFIAITHLAITTLVLFIAAAIILL